MLRQVNRWSVPTLHSRQRKATDLRSVFNKACKRKVYVVHFEMQELQPIPRLRRDWKLCDLRNLAEILKSGKSDSYVYLNAVQSMQSAND